MRSVSIVYKKGRRESHPELPVSSLGIKRSVDEYYSRLMEREKYRDQINHEKKELLERIKLKTSNSQRKNDVHHILETLSIGPVAFQPQETDRREEARNREKLIISRKLEGPNRLEGGKLMLKGLNLPVNSEQQEDEEQGEKNAHCKLKNLVRNRSTEGKETIVVMSANLVVDEGYFWGDEAVDQQAGKVWKTLQAHASIVWICQRESTAKKLQRFSKANSLRLDAVYLLLPRKNKRVLTVSYHPIEVDFGIRFHKSNTPLLSRDEKKMVVVAGLDIEHLDHLHYSSFYQTVPIIRNYRSVVHFLKVDPTDKNRFGAVMKILSLDQLPSPLDVLQILNEFERSQADEPPQPLGYPKQPVTFNRNLLSQLEQTKVSFMKHFSQTYSLSLTDKISYDQSENSLQFIIGDMLRRNYKIYQNYYLYGQQFEEYVSGCREQEMEREKRSLKEREREKEKEEKKTVITKKYRNKAYLWDI